MEQLFLLVFHYIGLIVLIVLSLLVFILVIANYFLVLSGSKEFYNMSKDFNSY